MNSSKTQKLTLAALFSALAYLTVFVFRIPFVPAVSFLKYEAKDCVIALETLVLGPAYGVATSFVVSLLEMVTISSTGPIGAAMNFISSCTFVLPVGIMYKRLKTLKTAVVGLSLGALLTTATMLLWNYFITPYYMGVSREVVAKLLLPGFLPFNLVKSTLNACLTYLLYKPLVKVLRKSGLLPQSDLGNSKHKGTLVVSAACVTVILAALVGAVAVSRG